MVILELGMGDGRLLQKFAKNSHKAFTYIGIEKDPEKYKIASSTNNVNLNLLHGSFEDILPDFPDASLDLVLSVLPDPSFIDIDKQEKWIPLYKLLYTKLKLFGHFRLITELTDDLLMPVSDIAFSEWLSWLVQTFTSIGYFNVSVKEGVPDGYSSGCIDLFSNDPLRIRMATLDFIKKPNVVIN